MMQLLMNATGQSYKPGRSTILLAMLWIFVVAGAAGQLIFDGQGWVLLVGLSSFAFIVALIWVLARARSDSIKLSDIAIFTSKRFGFWARILLLFLGLGVTFLLGMVITPGFSLMLVCGLIGLGVSIAWRRSLTWKIASTGLVLGLVSAVGSAFLGTGDIIWAIFNLITVPLAFTGGAILLSHTQLGHVRILESKPALVVVSFLMGCWLAIPPSLLERLGNMQNQDTYIIHWWQPLYAFVPGIAEETWFRLLLLSFCYAVLRPATNLRPQGAIVVAILISVFAFTFAHTGLSPLGMIYGFLFSMPHALLFIKKDFEHAVGYHFMIDFIRFIAAFLS